VEPERVIRRTLPAACDLGEHHRRLTELDPEVARRLVREVLDAIKALARFLLDIPE